VKYLIVAFLSVVLSLSDRADYTIRVKIHPCSNVKRQYSGTVYLIRAQEILDSVVTFQYVDHILFSYYKRNYDFRFRNLTAGNYAIKYQNTFKVDSLVNIELNLRNEETVDICFDKIPESFYKEKTPLDNLALGDTLRINCFLAAGEFGGHDEGLWIMRHERGYSACYYSLPNTYALRPEVDRIDFYTRERRNGKRKTEDMILSDHQIEQINRFLIQIKYYRTGSGWSNAPEFFSIYSSTDTIRRTKIESRWRPYSELKEKI